MSDEREQRIRQRAHAIWEAEGHPHGSDRDHWERATREVDAEAGAKKPGGAAKPKAKPAAAEKPAKAPVAKPGTTKPVTTKPVAAKPASTKPGKTKPA